MPYDLTFVAPHRRDEVLRRIGVLERFLAKPGRTAAHRSAGELGLGLTQFYRLARVWRENRKPERIAGSATARPRKTLATAEQLSFVELAVTDLPHDSVAAIASRAIKLGEAAGVAMPSLNSVRKIVELNRAGRVAPNSPAKGAEVVIATCALDLAVATPDGSLTMPVATIVIHTLPDPRVLGVALSFEDRCAAAAAHALIDACTTWRSPTHAARPLIAIGRGPGPDWSELVESIAASGAEVRLMEARAHSVMNDAVALLGRKPAGFRLAPDLTAKPTDLRRPTLPAGARALALRDAETLVRERLVAASPTAPLPGLTADAAYELVRRLRPIAGS